MKILHLMAAGNVGGIETLMKNYVTYSKHEHMFLFVFEEGEIAEELKQEGYETICLKKQKNNLARLQEILNYVQLYSFDLVITHHSSPILKLAIWAIKNRYPFVKVIAYAHADAQDICMHKKRGLWIRKIIHKIGFYKADKIISISDSVKESLIRYLKIKSKKIEVIYNGVPLTKRKQEVKSFSYPIRLVYVGRLIEEKGVQNIIEALSKLDRKYEYSFDIVGDGNYRVTLESMVRFYHLDEKVSFLGKKRNIEEILKEKDIFIHTPIWKEGFGITIVEAMSMGLLCVCSSNGAISEIISNQKNGFLVSAHSVEALRKQLENIFDEYESNDSYKEIRKNAILEAEKYSIDIFGQKLDHVIEMLWSKDRDEK